LTESKRAGKASIMHCQYLIVSPQKEFDRNDKENATNTTHEKKRH